MYGAEVSSTQNTENGAAKSSRSGMEMEEGQMSLSDLSSSFQECFQSINERRGSKSNQSTTGALEAAYMQATGKSIPLSEQQLVDSAVAFNNYGCNGGYLPKLSNTLNTMVALILNNHIRMLQPIASATSKQAVLE